MTRGDSDYVLLNTATDDDPDRDQWPDMNQLRPRSVLLGSKTCKQCRTANLKCEREAVDEPCRNCVEGGHTDSCVDKPPPVTYPPQPQPPSDSLPRSPSVGSGLRTPSSSSPLSFRVRVNTHSPASAVVALKSLCKPLYSYIPSLLPRVILPFLLFLPIHYASTADILHGDNDPSQYLSDFNEWMHQSRDPRQSSETNPSTPPGTANAAQPHPVLSTSTPLNTSAVYANANNISQHTDNASFVSLVALPGPRLQSPNIAEHRPTVAAIQRQPVLCSAAPVPPHSPTTPDLPPPDSIVKLHKAWLAYIHSRLYEWRISFGVAGFLFCTSPSILQIQGVSEDPLPCTLAFLAIFRAIVGVVYAPVFLYYFSERGYTHSIEFAILWTRATRASEERMKWAPWIMLSLPAAATLWAVVLYALSMLAFIWRVGATSDPVHGRTPLSEPMAYALRSVLTGATLLDIAGGVWVWSWMSWFKRGVGEMQRAG